MKLLVGLGNIGKEYAQTRHNIGFMAVDKICQDYNFIKISTKFSAEIFQGKIEDAGRQIIAIKPKTFMNESGLAVLETANFYKIRTENIFIFHDDIDLKSGAIKIKFGGGNAGHNGLKSIDSLLSNNYFRIRIGIGRPENKEFEISDYVLSKFLQEEFDALQPILSKLSKDLSLILSRKI